MKFLSITMLLLCLWVTAAPVSAGYAYKVLDQTQRIEQPEMDFGFVTFIVHHPSKIEPYIMIANTSIDPDLVNYTAKGPEIFKVSVYPDGTTIPVNLTSGNWTAYFWSGNSPTPETHILTPKNHFLDRIVFEGKASSGSGGC